MCFILEEVHRYSGFPGCGCGILMLSAISLREDKRGRDKKTSELPLLARSTPAVYASSLPHGKQCLLSQYLRQEPRGYHPGVRKSFEDYLSLAIKLGQEDSIQHKADSPPRSWSEAGLFSNCIKLKYNNSYKKINQK